MEIRRLTLSSDKIDALRQFYRETLGLQIVERGEQGFGVEAGWSMLEFVKWAPPRTSSPPPQYHFAFNIPSFQVAEARDWLAERVELLPYQGDTIVDFRNWNAEALYFYDPAGNIVEFIARKNLGMEGPGEFGPESILYLSEAGVPSADTENTYHKLKETANVPVYWGKPEGFCAAGDEEGLFILVPGTGWDWMPMGDPAHPYPMTVEFMQAGAVYELHLRADGQVDVRAPLIL